MTDDDYRAKATGIAEMIGDLTDVDVSLDPRAEVRYDIHKTGGWVQVWMWVSSDNATA